MTSTAQLDIIGTVDGRFADILTPEAVAFVVRLDQEFNGARQQLLAERKARRARLAAGGTLEFPTATRTIREDPDWRVAPAPADLVDRRVELTGPPERAMTVNALNAGANVWMADFEDATAPSWNNLITGQLNLLDAVHRRIDFTNTQGRRYRLTGDLPAIAVRPRGWHLPEHHVRVDGRAVSASLFDVGLYLYHCAFAQLDRGSGPYFYLPKLESAAEARLWNDVFCHAQDVLGLPRGTIRATVLIETVPAAFELEEILYELRQHVTGLNAGRWDYIFSVIKNFGTREGFVLPDRSAVTMTSPFLRAYTELLVRTCHRRGAHAIGGMAAFIPGRDPEVNERALAAITADKTREAADGFDGSWVAHPGLVKVCRTVFDEVLGDRPNQLDRRRDDVAVSAADLLRIDATPGQPTMAGLRGNVNVALRYLHAWLGGTGAVAIDGLMEDTATAEIARAQVWQWLHTHTRLADGPRVSYGMVMDVLDEEIERVRVCVEPPCSDLWRGENRRWQQARSLLSEMIFGTAFTESLTLPGYCRHLVTPC